MAITLLTTPQSFAPVYNPAYYTLSSTNIAKPQFNYVYDIFTSSTAYATRILAAPNPAGNGIFSPMRVIESYLSYDLSYNYVGWSAHTNCAMNYYVYFGESYAAVNAITGATIFSGLTSDNKIAWNGSLGYKKLSQFKYPSYQLTGSTSPFLTYMPSNVLIQSTEQASLSMMVSQTSANLPNHMVVTVYQTSGSSRTYTVNNINGLATTLGSYVNHFGSGPVNLNLLNNTQILTGVSSSYRPVIDNNIDSYYTLQVVSTSTGSTAISSIQTYTLDCQGNQYNGVRLMWLNSLGAFDYFTCKKVDRRQISVSPTSYRATLQPNYAVGARGVVVNDNDNQESRIVNTDLINDDTSIWLATELRQSIEAYEMQTDGTILPIANITFSTPENIKYMSDRQMAQYTIQYNYAYKNDVQRN